MNQSIREGRPEVMVAKAAGLILLFSLLLYIPILNIFALALVAVPVVMVTVRFGPEYGAAAALLAGLVLFFIFGPLAAVDLVLTMLLLGLSQGVATRSGFISFDVVFSGAFATMVALVLTALLVYSLTGQNVAKEQVETTKAFFKTQVEAAKVSGQNSQEMDEMLADFEKSLDDMVNYFPSIIFFTSWFTSTISYLLASKTLDRLGFLSPKRVRLKEMRIHPIFSWGFLIGLAAYLFSARFGAQAKVAQVAGLNMLIIFGSIFLLQGMGVVSYILNFRKLSGLFKAFFIIFSIFAQISFLGITWLGLFDTWFNYRKLSYDGP